MEISEKRLKALVLRILQELETEKRSQQKQQKVYMLCMNQWDERYSAFLKLIEQSLEVAVYPVIPRLWEKNGYEAVLRSYKSCKDILYRSCEKPEDFEKTVTLVPVVPRDLIVKTALCISDTFDTSWIASCMTAGSRIVFLRSGLTKFSGKEPEAYVRKILSYYRQVLEYGIEIGDGNGLTNISEKIEISGSTNQNIKNADSPLALSAPVPVSQGRKRMMTVSNVEQFATNGVIYRQPGDIVTDLAKDRAKFLNIIFK